MGIKSVKSGLFKSISLSLSMICFTCLCFGQSAGPYKVTQSNTTGGGNTTSKDTKSVQGSVGQGATGTAAGGRYEITGGLMNFDTAAILLGDVNGDRTVTVSDLVTLANFLAGNSSTLNPGAADLNEDGKVTITDLVILANYLAGNISILPVSQ